MNFKKLIELLVREDIPINSIIFKADWMEHWYVPETIEKHYGHPRLMCSSPTRQNLAQWDWSTHSNLCPHKVLSAGIEKAARRSIIPKNKPKIVIHLEGSRR